MNERCGCCEGLRTLTPMAIANRPGLDALAYRVGSHATFLETMEARLSSGDHPELAGLTTREASDPAIALLDAWATVGDVLTFYQERIANEGYLRTATERRSILELARLIGYALRPGVAASVHLAYTLDDGYEVEIPVGARAQSVPGPGELPQSFETAEKLAARGAWNNLQPRLTRPQKITPATKDLYLKGISTNLKPNDPLLIVSDGHKEVFRVLTVEADPEADRTLVIFEPWRGPAQPAAPAAEPALVAMPENLHAASLRALVHSLSEAGNLTESDLERFITRLAKALLTTFVVLADMPPSDNRERAIKEVSAALKDLQDAVHRITVGISAGAVLAARLREVDRWLDRALAILARQVTAPRPSGTTTLDTIIATLHKPVSVATLPPRDGRALSRDLRASFAEASDLGPRLLTYLEPRLGPQLYAAWRNAVVTEPSAVKVYALRVRASLFGHNAQKEPQYEPETLTDNRHNPKAGQLKRQAEWPEWAPDGEDESVLFLDTNYDQILPGSYIAVHRPDLASPVLFSNISVRARSRNAYGISAKTTMITLADGDTWWDPGNDITPIRGTTVCAQSEELALADAPIDPVDEPIRGATIELGALYDGLESGRWLVVSGERTDIANVTGVRATELVMLAGVHQGADHDAPGDTTRTTLILANQLAYTYKRDTVTIHGNVVKATHGETRNEVLGSGDGSKVLQTFGLRQPPLTFVAAPTPDGAESSLHVHVSDVEWCETDSLGELESTDRRFITRTDDDNKTAVIFGNGQKGARLPTGVENVRAVYRNGIGKPGNVKAEQISLLVTRPLGVKGVINPLRASGGADRDNKDRARRNAPLAVTALDRLVSVPDYADFARTFAGIGKAVAARLSDGHRQIVHVTIAGADDIPIDENSDLYRNLGQALLQFGDPYQPIQVVVRELLLLAISAKVRIVTDYLWEKVEPKMRAALLETFSFDRRELGQDALLSEAISTIQRVEGVAYVDVDVFGGVPEKAPDVQGKRRLLTPGEVAKTVRDMVDQAKKTRRPQPRVEVNLANFENGAIRPAQLAFLNPEVPDTLILTELPK